MSPYGVEGVVVVEEFIEPGEPLDGTYVREGDDELDGYGPLNIESCCWGVG